MLWRAAVRNASGASGSLALQMFGVQHRIPLREPARGAPVQVSPLRGQHGGVHGVCDQGMGEEIVLALWAHETLGN